MRHNHVTLFELVAAVDVLGGPAGLRAVLAGRDFKPVKYGDMTVGEFEAGRNKIPEEVWAALLRDEVELVMGEPNRVVVRRKEQLMVDGDGRFIFRNIKQVGPPNWAFGFNRTTQSYSEVLKRLEHAFQCQIGISATAFEMLAERKKAEIWDNPFYGYLFKGQFACPFAIALPRMQVPKEGGLGELLARTIIPAAKLGYARKYAERTFNDSRGDTLIGQTESFSGSRQDRLIAALAKGPQVLWVFLNCLQGASIDAARELIQTLPEEFILGGTLVNAPVIAAYPEIAAASNKNPLYFHAADVFQLGPSLYLYPFDDGVNFDYWNGLGRSDGDYSASVAVLA